tara:strand:- start:23988 stop:24275 length:288 start_codon:yes stop_codon:yes gene_type:complete
MGKYNLISPGFSTPQDVSNGVYFIDIKGVWGATTAQIMWRRTALDNWNALWDEHGAASIVVDYNTNATISAGQLSVELVSGAGINLDLEINKVPH